MSKSIKKLYACIALLLSVIISLAVLAFNSSAAFAAMVTMEENPVQQFTGSVRDKYKNELFYSDTFTNEGYELNYRYYTPADMSRPVPLVIELHGRGERGSDNDSQLNNAFVRPYFENENSKFYDAMVIVPQCPVKDFNNGWLELFDNEEDANNLNYNNYSVDNIEETDETKAIVALIESTCQKYNIDRSRIYIIGLSQGAMATWYLIARHSDLFAAAVPIAGVGDVSKAALYADMPVFAFHGNADTTVPYERAKPLYDAIEARGKGKFNLVTYEGGPHAIWESAIVFPGNDTLPSLEDWLFSQSKATDEGGSCASGCAGTLESSMLTLCAAIAGIGAFIAVKKFAFRR